MKVLTRSEAGTLEAVAFFGLGLLGRPIAERLTRSHRFRASHVDFPWNAVGTPTGLAAQKACFDHLDEMSGGGARDRKLIFAWFAGRSGPLANETVTRQEVTCFDSLFSRFCQFADGRTRLEAFVVSSAGGILESVGETSDVVCPGDIEEKLRSPNPQNPYGRAKLAIESRLRDAKGLSHYTIYRPSSVFGLARPGCRKGLITTIVINALERKESVLFARPGALRDYVWGPDISDHVARAIAKPGSRDSGTGSIEHLVRGKALSILGVKHRIERQLGRPVAARFEPPKALRNDADLVFPQSLRPPGWRTRGLDECIARIVQDHLYGPPSSGDRAA